MRTRFTYQKIYNKRMNIFVTSETKIKFPKMSRSTIRRILNLRVNRGIKFLDKHFGREIWLEKIDLKILDLSSTKTCMCGQLFGDYMNVIQDGRIKDNDTAAFHGFNFRWTDDEQWDTLTHIWYCRVFHLRGR